MDFLKLVSKISHVDMFKLNSSFRVFLVCCFAIIVMSCEKEGVCEVKIEANGYIYSCREGSTEETCNDSSGVERVFHEGKSCASLGYPFKNSSGAYTAEQGKYRTPGDNGAFQNDLNNTGSSGGVAGCSGGYNGPTFDIQIDSQCQAAYAYKCAGSQQGVDATCAIYKTYQRNDPSIPNCPYCS